MNKDDCTDAFLEQQSLKEWNTHGRFSLWFLCHYDWATIIIACVQVVRAFSRQGGHCPYGGGMFAGQEWNGRRCYWGDPTAMGWCVNATAPIESRDRDDHKPSTGQTSQDGNNINRKLSQRRRRRLFLFSDEHRDTDDSFLLGTFAVVDSVCTRPSG